MVKSVTEPYNPLYGWGLSTVFMDHSPRIERDRWSERGVQRGDGGARKTGDACFQGGGRFRPRDARAHARKRGS